MNREQAKKLIRETFEEPFDKEKYSKFVNNLLKRIDFSKAFHARGYVNEAFKKTAEIIKTYERIGTYTDASAKKIDVLIVYLEKNNSLDKARTTMRNFVAQYLKNRGEKDAALVAFVPPDKKDWRFSFVEMDYRIEETPSGKFKAKKVPTPARRWSFLVGKNEKSHTAQSRFVPILENDDWEPTLEDLEQAFNVEVVTKEFFQKYRDLFIRTKLELDKIVKNDAKIRQEFEDRNINTVDFAKKLIGQITFLYFLQKKGWFGVERGKPWGTGPKDFMRRLFKREFGNYRNFYDDILEPLFYEALSTNRSAADHYYSRFNCKIPFLNGGLFDPINNYDWVKTDILIPDKLFSNNNKTKEGDIGDGILDVFDRYNFTVNEEEPLEKEVALDPELLGKTYEKLNAIRADNFDEYLQVLQSGRKGEETKFNKEYGVYYTPREIVHYMCQESLINYLATETSCARNDIEEFVKFSDSIQEMEATSLVKQELIEAGDIKSTKYESQISECIRNNAKQIDNLLANIKVCDPAVGSGAFPIGMMHEVVKLRQLLSIYTGEQVKTYDLKRHAIENSLYGVDIDPGAVEICKLRFWLSMIVDEEDFRNIKPLPNLDYKVVCGNSLLGVEKNLYNYQAFSKLEALKPQYFNETNPTEKQQLKNEIDKLIYEITKGHKKFDFEVYFSEVFHEKGGFDIVIANPPYIKEYISKKAFDGLRDSPYYQGKMDIWNLFACKGIDLLKKNSGILTYIAQNNWVTSYGASKMRNKVIKHTQIVQLIDFGSYEIFESSDIQTMIMIFKADSKTDNYIFDYRRLKGDGLNFNDVLDLLNYNQNSKTIYLKPTIQRDEYIDKLLTFSSTKIDEILNKLSEQSNFKLTEKEIAQGIIAPQDYVIKGHLKKLPNLMNGEGIFFLTNKEKNRIPFTEKELELIKPLYTTKELRRYYADRKNSEWVIYTDSKFKNPESIKPYPNVKRHLDKFQKIITSDNKPYGLHRARDESFFKGEKIVAVRKCKEPTFTYTDFDCYVSATFCIVKTERINLKYLTALLNSKLIAFWLKHKGKMQGNNYQIDKEPLLALPLKNIPTTDQQPFIDLVDKILTITKDEDYLENPGKQAQVKEYERQIDQLVYELYGLTEEERRILERV